MPEKQGEGRVLRDTANLFIKEKGLGSHILAKTVSCARLGEAGLREMVAKFLSIHLNY